jgi:hypothetical protein
VAGDVGQRLLRDAVEHDLDVLVERDTSGRASIDEHAALAREARRQRVERARQTELHERVGRRSRRCGAVLERAPGALARLLEVGLVGSPDRLIDLQQDAGQRWPSSSCSSRANAAALGLLGSHGAARAVAALVLQPVEHLVERLGQLAHSLAAARCTGACGRERVDGGCA